MQETQTLVTGSIWNMEKKPCIKTDEKKDIVRFDVANQW